MSKKQETEKLSDRIKELEEKLELHKLVFPKEQNIPIDFIRNKIKALESRIDFVMNYLNKGQKMQNE